MKTRTFCLMLLLTVGAIALAPTASAGPLDCELDPNQAYVNPWGPTIKFGLTGNDPVSCTLGHIEKPQ